MQTYTAVSARSKITLDKINRVLITILIFSLVFFPRDSLNIKKGTFALLLILNIDTIISYLRKSGFALLFAVCYPVYLIVMTVIQTGDIATAVSNAYVMLYILLIPIIRKTHYDYLRSVSAVLTVFALFVAASGLLDVFGIIKITNNPILQWLSEHNEARAAYWSVSTFGYLITLFAYPSMVLLLAYVLHDKVNLKNVLIALIVITAAAFSGARATFYACVAMMAYFILIATKKKGILRYVLILGMIAIATTYFSTVIEYITNLNDSKTSTDMIKANHVLSIIKLFRENPLYILSGTGLGSYFYTTGRDSLQNLTELSFIELFRQMGLIGFIPFLVFLFKPIRKLYHNVEYRWLLLPYIAFLGIASTNPFLFGSTSFIMYDCVYLYSRSDVEK